MKSAEPLLRQAGVFIEKVGHKETGSAYSFRVPGMFLPHTTPSNQSAPENSAWEEQEIKFDEEMDT